MTRKDAIKIFTDLSIFGKAPCKREELKDLCKIVLVALEQESKIEKISSILKTAKADPTRDEYAEYYLDAIEEVVRWIQI